MGIYAILTKFSPKTNPNPIYNVKKVTIIKVFPFVEIDKLGYNKIVLSEC
jgi:hypothetical protein